MNQQKTIVLLLQKLQVKFSRSFVKKFLSLQQSLSSPTVFVDLLARYNIDSMVVQFSSNELSEIDYPAVAQVRNGDENQYVILDQYQGNALTYTSHNQKQITESISDFEAKWNGLAILFDPSNKTDESNYVLNQQEDRQEKLQKSLLWTACILVLGTLVYFVFRYEAVIAGSLLALKFFGMYVSIHLIRKSAGLLSRFSDSVCFSKKTEQCNQVLQSNASKIVHISLADLGFIYFSVTGFFVLLSLVNPVYLDIVRLGSVIVLPFTLFSIYYQWRIIKSWCTMCLLIVGTFWLEFAVSSVLTWSMPSLRLEVILTVGSLALSVVVLFMLFKKNWQKDVKSKGIERKYYAFRNHEAISHTVIENGPAVSPIDLSSMELGKAGAQNELLIVSGPLCKPCATMHEELVHFIKYFEGYLSVKIVPSLSAHRGYPNSVARHMINYLTSDQPNKLQMLDAWFNIKMKNNKSVEKWLNTYELDKDEPIVQKDIVQWLGKNQINYTPCFILNGKVVHNEYTLRDIKKHIRQKLS